MNYPMSLLFAFSGLAACASDSPSKPPTVAGDSSDSGSPELDSDAVPDSGEGEGEGETGVSAEDTWSCGDEGASDEPFTWTTSAVAPTYAGEDMTCSAVDFVDWELTEEWRTSDFYGFVMNPVVAPMDGNRWSAVFVERGAGVDIFDGRDGSKISTIDYSAEEDGSTPMVGDADGDGDLEFVSTSWLTVEVADLGSGELHAFNQRDPSYTVDEVCGWVDADRDGQLDILLEDSTFSLHGELIAEIPPALEPTGIFAADLDQDGTAEVMTSSGIYSAADGSGAEWPFSVPGGNYSFYGAPVQVDDEVDLWFGVGRGELYLTDHTGDLIETMEMGGERWLASIGDVDGDGRAEMCVMDEWEDVVALIDLSGEPLWTWPVTLGMASGGCSMADLDADGLYEVLLTTYDGFAIVDGATGVPLEEVSDTGTTIRDTAPVVADIDGDGSAEIILANASKVTVYGAASGRFARTRPVWNQLAYDITSIRDDGTLVSWPLPSWEAYNAFRAQPAHDGEHPDLSVEILDTCTDICTDEGTVGVHVRVGNRGSVAATAGSSLDLLSIDDAGPVTLATLALDEDIAPGDGFDAWIWARRSDFDGRLAMDLRTVDEDECDRVNNREMVNLSCE